VFAKQLQPRLYLRAQLEGMNVRVFVDKLPPQVQKF
jgi:hypothetical protein